ncbi:protein kinase [Vibrio neptunius]
MSKISLGILCALGCIGAANAADHQLNEQRDLREALELSQALEISKQQAAQEQQLRDNEARELAEAIELSKALELSKQQALKEQQLRDNEARELAEAIELSKALELSKQQALKEQQLRDNEARELAEAIELSKALELSKQQAQKEQNQLEIDTANILESLKGLGMPLEEDYQPHISEVEVIEDIQEPVDFYAAMGAPVHLSEQDLSKPLAPITSTKKVDGIASQEKEALDALMAKQEEKQLEIDTANILESLKGLGMPLEDEHQKYISEVEVIEDIQEPVDLYAVLGAPVVVGEEDLSKPLAPITSTQKVDGIASQEKEALDTLIEQSKQSSLVDGDSTELNIDLSKVLEGLKGLGMPLEDEYQPYISEVEVIEDIQEPVDLYAVLGAPVLVGEEDLSKPFAPIISTQKVDGLASIELLNEPLEEQPHSALLDSLYSVKAKIARDADAEQGILAMQVGDEFEIIQDKHMPWLWAANRETGEAGWVNFADTEYTQRSLDLFKRRDLAQLKAKQAREAASFTVKAIGYFDAAAFEGTEEIERLTNTKVFSLEEGEQFYITDYSEDWWEAIDAQGNTGLVPSNLVEIVEKMTGLEHSALERHASIVSPKHVDQSMGLTHVEPDLIKGTELKASKYKLADEKDFYFRARLLSELHAQNAQIFGQSAGSLEGIYAGVDWHVGDKIQSGAFGAIYPITFTLPSGSAVQMALKVISSYKVDINSINNELGMLKKFNGHPRFVSYYGSYQTKEGDYIIAMELMEGDVFDEAIPYTSTMFTQVVDALAELRKEGIFHGDIKAENVLHKNGQYYMADLGGSKQAYFGVEHPHVAFTWLTSAPEIEHVPHFALTRQNLAQENPYLLDPFAADVFSAGMTLMLKKHEKFAAEVWKTITDERDTYASEHEMDRMYKMTLIREFTALVQAKDGRMDAEDTLLAQMVKPNPEERITVAELQRALLKQRLM